MSLPATSVNNTQLYYRLIALWVICEAMLGGIIHGLKLPVSGLIVGSSAVICISLIGFYHPEKGAIIRATIIIAIFKMMLSPQSPVAAYIAVFFQGVLGQFIYRGNKNFRSRCFVFAVVALIESAVQRIFVMTIIGGKDIWIAINTFISGLSGQETISNYSLYLCVGYIVIHIIAGMIVGNISSKIPGFVSRNRSEMKFRLKPQSELAPVNNHIIKKKKGPWIFIVWILLLAIFIHSKYSPEHALLPQGLVMKLMMRSAIIILTWIAVVNPLIMLLLKKWLENKKSESGNDIKQITLLLPYTQELVRQSWFLSSEKKGFRRLSLFFRIIMINSLSHE